MMEEEDCDDELAAASAIEYCSSVISSPAGTTITKKGTLSKKGTGLLYKPWSRRIFTVDTENRLSYFDANFFMRGNTVI